MIEDVALAPAVTFVTPGPVIEYMAPAPVIEYIVPSTISDLCQAQSSDASAYTTGLVNPQCSITAVEASAPQDDGSISSLDEFTARVQPSPSVTGETIEMPTPSATPAPAMTYAAPARVNEHFASAHVAHE